MNKNLRKNACRKCIWINYWPFQFVLFSSIFSYLCNTKIQGYNNLPNKKRRLLSFLKQKLMNRYVLLVCTLRNSVRMSTVRLSLNHFAVFSLVSAEFLLYDAFLFHYAEKWLVCRLQQHHLSHSYPTDSDFFVRIYRIAYYDATWKYQRSNREIQLRE